MKAYFIFFSYNRALPRPIAVFFDKNKAFKHIHQFGEEHVELRMCDWKDAAGAAQAAHFRTLVPNPFRKQTQP